MPQSARSWFPRPCQGGVTVFRGRPAITFDALFYAYVHRGRVAQWLRRCATNRKVAGSIPDSVIRIFH